MSAQTEAVKLENQIAINYLIRNRFANDKEVQIVDFFQSFRQSLQNWRFFQGTRFQSKLTKLKRQVHIYEEKGNNICPKVDQINNIF